MAVLTNREREVVQLIMEGLSNGQIATKLYISPATVKTHIVRIGSKLGTGGNRVRIAVAFARLECSERHWVDAPEEGFNW